MIVGIEMATNDRPSFKDWWPIHLDSVLELVDQLHIRLDPSAYEPLQQYLDLRFPYGEPPITWEYQTTQFGRFQEDFERQQLLGWALGTGADWAVCFDADEVIEPDGGAALKRYLLSPAATFARLVQIVLTYTSHHRPGYVLPRGGFMPYRAFRLDKYAAGYRYQSDEDGLHCGSVPAISVGAVIQPELRVIHYHATTCAEYLAKREFYANTVEVEKHGGIDHLYRCDRFGDERHAVYITSELAGAAERLRRVSEGSSVQR